MKFNNKVLAFLAVAMFVALPSFAQTGTIHGKVVEADGKPAAGVSISIDRQAITQHFDVKTDAKGSYLHAGLPTGQYNLSVEKDGKKVNYYLAKNKVSDDFHSNICKESKKVTATGTVKEVDGKKEFTAKKIELADKKE